MVLDPATKNNIRLDDQDIIDRCLSCQREKCNNCVADIAQKKERRKRTDNLKAIDMLDLEGNYIKTFPSMAEAAMMTDTKRQNIYACLKGRCTRAGKFRWRYAKGVD